MTNDTDRKPSPSLGKQASNSTSAPTPVTPQLDNSSITRSTADLPSENFRDTLKALDAKRTELVKNAIDNIKPGRTFNAGVVRQINKIETARNRLIVAHFAWLLKRNPEDVHAIVHQIIEL